MPTRREFVRGCIIASAGVAAAGGLYGAASLLAPEPPAPQLRRVDYFGAALVTGPAVRGVPLLPLLVAPDGAIAGNPAPRSVPGGVLGWYRYCAHEQSLPLQPGFPTDDERLRYFATKDKLESAPMAGDAWWADKVGEVANVADFAPGKGAPVAWRSAGMQGKNIITATLVRAPGEVVYEDRDLQRVVEEGFAARTASGGTILGFVTFCPHFCCVMGWHESPLAKRRSEGPGAQNVWDALYCNCHDVVCDALRIRRDFFVSPAR
ncbi:MAG: hypothetical protein LC624_08060 [Halobacteriales archaeon]|nr:hypothetical protein [Halobacteriales archaeon]